MLTLPSWGCHSPVPVLYLHFSSTRERRGAWYLNHVTCVGPYTRVGKVADCEIASIIIEYSGSKRWRHSRWPRVVANLSTVDHLTLPRWERSRCLWYDHGTKSSGYCIDLPRNRPPDLSCIDHVLFICRSTLNRTLSNCQPSRLNVDRSLQYNIIASVDQFRFITSFNNSITGILD